MLDTNLSLKIEIKDKKRFILQAAMIIAILGLFSLFLWQLKSTLDLHHGLEQKSTQLKEAKTKSKRLKKLESQQYELEQKENEIREKIPLNELQPFGLIRSLAAIGAEIGLRNTAFRILSDKESASTQEETESAQSYNTPPSQNGLIAIDVEMSGEGTYAQLIDMLEKTNTLKRIVSVKEVTIERKEEIVPYQSIRLLLTAYSFPLPTENQ